MEHMIRGIFLALALACGIYAVSIYRVGSGTFSFVIWIAGTVFFCACFYLAGKSRWGNVPVSVRRTCYGLIAFAVATMLICVGAMMSHFGDKGEKDLDYVIVLGAQMRSYGPSIIFQYRLDAAYEYLTENPDAICIVSGGKGDNEIVSEGEGGKKYLMEKGIPEDRILAETTSVDTSENIANSLNLIREERAGDGEKLRIGIVTNNFHVFRGVRLTKKLAGAETEVCGIAAYTVPWYLPNNMLRECFGIIKDIPNMF